MTEGDAARLTRMLDGLKGEGAAPLMALWSFTEEIRAIGKLLAGVDSGRPLNTLWRDARIWDNARQHSLQQNLRRFNAVQVTQALRHAAAIDRMVKGLASGDVWDELLQLALRFRRK